MRPVDPAIDWTEDAWHENGAYQNRCCHCGRMFMGYKRRVECKKCHTESAPPQPPQPAAPPESEGEEVYDETLIENWLRTMLASDAFNVIEKLGHPAYCKLSKVVWKIDQQAARIAELEAIAEDFRCDVERFIAHSNPELSDLDRMDCGQAEETLAEYAAYKQKHGGK